MKTPEQIKTEKLRALRLERDRQEAKFLAPHSREHKDRIYECEDKMLFGKHHGKTIEQIMVEDIGYITWLLENVASFHLSDYAEAIYLELTDPRNPR